MTCKEAVRHLYLFLDRELAGRKSPAVQRHLDRCHACCTKFEFEKALKSLVREKAREMQVPFSVKQRVARLLRAF
jgi:mycothiol system anti-sigma-R factor